MIKSLAAAIESMDGTPSASAVVDSILNGAAYHQPVPAKSVRAWLSEGGLRERLERWMANTQEAAAAADLSDLSAEEVKLFGLRSGVQQLLVAADSDELEISPGRNERALLETAVAEDEFPFKQADLDRIHARALIGFDRVPKTSDVTGAMAYLQRRDAANATREQISAYQQAQRQALAEQVTAWNAACLAHEEGTGSLPTIPE